jgi:hypothetical protein
MSNVCNILQLGAAIAPTIRVERIVRETHAGLQTLDITCRIRLHNTVLPSDQPVAQA